MTRTQIDQLMNSSARQLSETYRELADRVSASDDFASEPGSTLADVLVEMNLAANKEDALNQLTRMRAGMRSAQEKIDDAMNRPTPESIRESPLACEMFADTSEEASVGELLEVRKALMRLADPESYEENSQKALRESQRFAALPTDKQLAALSALYQKALDQTVESSLKEFHRITSAVPASFGEKIGSDTELIYAAAVAGVMRKNGIMADGIYEYVGAYTHTAICVVNEKSAGQRVDPVFDEETANLLASILSIFFIVVFVILAVNYPVSKTAAGKAVTETTAIHATLDAPAAAEASASAVQPVIKSVSKMGKDIWGIAVRVTGTFLITRLLSKPIIDYINQILTGRKQRLYDREKLDYLRRIRQEDTDEAVSVDDENRLSW